MSILIFLIIAYVLVCVLLFFFQRRIVYLNAGFQTSEPIVADWAKQLELEPWHDANGNHLGWKRVGKPGGPAAVQFHGNAGFALHRSDYVNGMDGTGDGWTVYLAEYPGYGCRPGSPCRTTLIDAGCDAVDEVSRLGHSKIFLIGESLGSGVACAVAERRPDTISGLLLVVPFARLKEVAQWHYPIIPVMWLMTEDFDNRKAIQNYSGPLAMVIAGKDEIIPSQQGRDLFSGFKGPKRLWEQEYAYHNSIGLDRHLSWWKEASTFLLTQSR
jgi:hypothetical protein